MIKLMIVNVSFNEIEKSSCAFVLSHHFCCYLQFHELFFCFLILDNIVILRLNIFCTKYSALLHEI